MEAKPLAGTDGAIYPFWSPDSRTLGFFADRKLRKIDAAGGPAQELCDAFSGRGGAWSKDGVIVFAPSGSPGMMRVSAAGGTPEFASTLDTSKGENIHRWPYFFPDGRHFLYWARNNGGTQEHALYVGTLGSLQARLLTKSETMAVYASGYLLFLRGTTLMAQPFDPRRVEFVGDAISVAEHVAVDPQSAHPIFSPSDNGVLVYQPGDTSAPEEKLAWFTRDGKQPSVISQGEDYQGLVLSPDGARLAVAIVDRSQQTENIWIVDLHRGTKTRLTFGGGIQNFPVWTPDGKTLYFSSNAQGPAHIYAKSADGTGEERAVLGSINEVAIPESISPDGQYLAYTRQLGTGRRNAVEVWALPLFGDGKPFPIVQNNFNSTRPVVSPDGKWMAYANYESGRAEIYITAFPGGGAKWQVSTNGGSQPQWSKGGRELFFLDPSNTLMAVDVNAANSTVKLGIPHVLFKPPGVNQYYWFAVSADGTKFVFVIVSSIGAGEPLTLVQNWTADLKK